MSEIKNKLLVLFYQLNSTQLNSTQLNSTQLTMLETETIEKKIHINMQEDDFLNKNSKPSFSLLLFLPEDPSQMVRRGIQMFGCSNDIINLKLRALIS